MSLDKYYDALYVDGKLNNSFVTYLSYIHIYNSLVKRDNITNVPLNDLGVHYAKRAHDFYQACNYPLVYLKDDIHTLYDYTIPHIENILEKPHKDIIKEPKLVRKEKLKNVDAKTLVWLANKPGSTIREKLANVEKVSSTTKRYTYNIKENQVLLAFFKDITRLLNTKSNIIKNNPALFGEDNFVIINEINRRLNRIRFHFKNELEEVVEKDYPTPNNALMGNVDYSSVWKSYTDIKQNQIDSSNAFDKYKKILKSLFIYIMMNRYEYVESYGKVEEATNHIIYDNTKDVFTEIVISNSNEFEILINKYDLKDNSALIESKKNSIEMIESELEQERGQAYSLLINNETFGLFYADVLGAKEVIEQIIKSLFLKEKYKETVPKTKHPFKYASINSFDNRIYCNDNSTNCNTCFDGIMYENNSVFYANTNNCYLNSYKNDNYSSFLKLMSRKQDFGTNGIVVYDINDNFDEFSSVTLRRNFASIYPQSYPVWRSILVGESSKAKEKIRTVLDFCGKDFSISKLERKNKKFVHCGPVEIPIYYQIVNEKICYDIYISEYEKKYHISYPKEFVDNIIASGGLYSILVKDQNGYISLMGTPDNHKVWSMGFDSDCYSKMVEEFKAAMNVILEKYDKDSTMIIVPDFLKGLTDNRIITNQSLITGVDTIIDRINNHEVAWYEKLPKLSLEIIKNGMFDNLVLVDNQECENIIGKRFTISVPERLTLSAGQKNYILPLNKSFIGEQNEAFVAKAMDSSFPLTRDMEVRLVLEYSFGAENSYNLFLYPIDNKAPFEKIEIKWEKEEANHNLICPTIKDVIYDKESLDKELNDKIPHSLKNFDFHIRQVMLNRIKSNNGKNNLQEACKDVQILINREQRIAHYSEKSKSAVRKLINEANVEEKVRYLIQKTIDDIEADHVNDKYMNILIWRLSELEEGLTELTFDKSLFVNKLLKYPESCFGRYFAEYPNDEDVLSIAYQKLVEITSKDGFFEEAAFRRYMNKLTAATACRHQVIYEMAQINPTYISYLLKVIINSLKELSIYDWNKSPEECSYYNTPKENGFLIRYCVELLISFLYCRELIYFYDLQPGGKLANEIIYYLKIFNRNIMKAMETWEDETKKSKMLKTKYHISLEKPAELMKMWNEAYCLILYLSGDQRANYIKIGTGD